MEKDASACCSAVQGRDHPLGQSRLSPRIMSDMKIETQLSHLVFWENGQMDGHRTCKYKHKHTHARTHKYTGCKTVLQKRLENFLCDHVCARTRTHTHTQVLLSL